MEKDLNTVITEIHPQIKEFLQKIEDLDEKTDYYYFTRRLEAFIEKEYKTIFSAVLNLLESSPDLWLEDIVLSNQEFFLDVAKVSEFLLKESANSFAYRSYASVYEKPILSIDKSVDCPIFTTFLYFATQAGIKKWNLDSKKTAKIMTNVFLRELKDELLYVIQFLNRSKDPGIFLENFVFSELPYEDEEDLIEAIIKSPRHNCLAFSTGCILFLYKNEDLREKIRERLQVIHKTTKSPVEKKWIKLIVSTLSSLEKEVKEYLNRPKEKLREKLEILRKALKEVISDFSPLDRKIKYINYDSTRKTLEVTGKILDRIFDSTVIQHDKNRKAKIDFSVESFDVEGAAKSVARATEKLKTAITLLREEIENAKHNPDDIYDPLYRVKRDKLPEVVKETIKEEDIPLFDVNVDEFLIEIETKRFFEQKIAGVYQTGVTGILYLPEKFKEEFKDFLFSVVKSAHYVKSNLEWHVKTLCKDFMWNVALLRSRKPETDKKSIIGDFERITNYRSVYKWYCGKMEDYDVFNDLGELIPDVMLNYEEDYDLKNKITSLTREKLERYLNSRAEDLLFVFEVCDVIFRNTQFWKNFKEEARKMLGKVFYGFPFEPSNPETVEEIMHFVVFYEVLKAIFSCRSREILVYNSGLKVHFNYPHDVYKITFLSGLFALSGCTEEIRRVIDLKEIVKGELFIPLELCVKIGKYLYSGQTEKSENKTKSALPILFCIETEKEKSKNKSARDSTKIAEKRTKEKYSYTLSQLELFS